MADKHLPTSAGWAGGLHLADLAVTFLKIGALAFGETELVMIERELVDRRPVLTPADLTDALTFTKALPGSTVVQIVAFLGYRIGGWRGSAVATLVYLTPSTIAMMLLALVYGAISDLPALRPAAHGLTAAAAGLLLATAWRLARRSIEPRVPISLVIALVSVVATGLFGVSSAFVVLGAGLIGVLAFARTAGEAGAAA